MNTLGWLLFAFAQMASGDSPIPAYHTPKTVHPETYLLLQQRTIMWPDSGPHIRRTIL